MYNYNLNNINSFSANVDEIFHLIETSKKILIATHENPEGDAISSAMSMGMFLKSLDKEIYLFCNFSNIGIAFGSKTEPVFIKRSLFKKNSNFNSVN